MRRVRASVSRVLLAMASTTAIAGLLVALHAWWLAPGVVLLALSPFVEWHPVPARLARVLPPATRLALVASFLLLWFTRPLPLLAQPASQALPLAGAVLAALTCVFALAPRSFPPWRSLVPALVGVLAVAGADPSPAGHGSSAVPAFRAAGHNGFADLYVPLALLVAAALWAAALVAWGPAWTARRRPELAVSVALSLALAGALVVGLPLAQPHLERAVISAFDASAAGATTGLSGESVLGEFERLAVSRRRVLDLHAFPPTAGLRLLPCEVLIRFAGTRWLRESTSAARPMGLVPSAERRDSATLGGLGPWFRLPLPARALITPGRLDELRFTPLLPEAWPLLLPRGVAAVTAAVEVLELDADGLVRVGPGALPAIYGAVVATAPAAAADDDAGREAALQVPAGLDPRLRALAARLVPQDTAPAERVARVVAHLRGGYAYTLAPGRFRPEADPVAQFLFEKKQGYCEYFATAAVLLLRLTGVPARFVKGLRVSRRDDYGDGLFVLRESDAHAWVEAWLPGRGWVEVDPTPPALAGGDTRSPGTAEKAIERLRAAGAEAWALLTGPGPLSLVRWLAASALGWLDLRRAALAATLLAMLFVGRRLWRRLRDAHRERRRRLRARASQSVPVELRRAIVDLEQRWRASGQPRPPSRGLREHAALVTPSSAAGAPALAAQRLVALYYAARFGGQAPRPEEVARLHE